MPTRLTTSCVAFREGEIRKLQKQLASRSAQLAAAQTDCQNTK